MTPLHLLVAGGLALLAGAAVLRSFGPAYRVGRLLSTTPLVTVAEALAIAEAGEARYVRVDGRIDADEPFEDSEHRPLVLRRTTFEARRGDRWETFETSVEGVDFQVSEGLDAIGVEGGAIDAGLVVVPRESVGVVGDLGDRAPDELPDALPARVVVRHVSSVEHATILGVPSRGADGSVAMRPGLGRPLVLTTLEIPEAMRVLTAGSSARPRLAAAALALGAALVVGGLAWGLVQLAAGVVAPTAALAASPEAPAPSVPAVGSDTRSSGQGPGFVGDPLAAIVAVVALGLLSVAATQAWVRLTRPRGGPGPDASA